MILHIKEATTGASIKLLLTLSVRTSTGRGSVHSVRAAFVITGHVFYCYFYPYQATTDLLD